MSDAPAPAHRFPFGRLVAPCLPSADAPRRLLVLGAYPSALHIRWIPPEPHRPIAALAVDNEPTPFWTGEDQAIRVERWKEQVGWDGRWGECSPVGGLNGPSGAWVARRVLRPLGAGRDDAWITDCLDTYRVSTGAEARILDTYRPFAGAYGLPADLLGRHPSESEIVVEALRDHRARLLRELEEARPSLLVTLGNAALRVVVGLGAVADGSAPKCLTTDGYGRARRIRLGQREVEWLPLAHPAAPQMYQEAHAQWCASSVPSLRRLT